ncbi:MAG TPA: DUF2330 domain-containing protein [Chitinophagales bacterium]|nr:DUF2330 domain-containing protein [Chitinophagales bacterium]
MKKSMVNGQSSIVNRNWKLEIGKWLGTSVFLYYSLFSIFQSQNANAFCGFYVAKADATLFNKTSQVILVRDGDKTTITMSSDFEGSVKDFAMVVPVPVVLKRDDIRTVASSIFKTLDDYSAPRLSEYYDDNPCAPKIEYDVMATGNAVMYSATMEDKMVMKDENYHVTIEAQYTVDEYDILILSAKESSGLERWLTDNGYKIPAGAREVLTPYINSNLKFFVVKVNTEELRKKGTDFLSPLQISFHSPKFMLPIRLGMANAKGSQDMIVYAFTQKGRIETTNYSTVEVPSGNTVPEFVQDYFGKFYVDVYRKHRKESGENNVYVEYAWNISGNVSQFCDPCNGPPPMLQDLMTVGVDWVQNYHTGYQGDVFFTRLHVTYDRKNFPQDLMFEETPNRENFQARYSIRHPAYGDFQCAEGKTYVRDVMKRRKEELTELAILTGWDLSEYYDYAVKFAQFIPNTEPRYRVPQHDTPKQIEVPEQNPLLNHDTSRIKQESFGAPFYTDDNGNASSGNLMIVTISTMILLIVMMMITRLRKENGESAVKKIL